jgi:hypothetical protein
MNVIHYIGLDVHKKTISYCIKTADGRIVQEGSVAASRLALRSWVEELRLPWCGAMEATLFSALIHDALKPYAPFGDGSSGKDEKLSRLARRRAIRSMPGRSPIYYVAIYCLPATSCRQRCATSGDCCGIAIWWCSSPCACRTRWLAC